ncbi:hypothetical protein ACFE04_017621 [Oxalis oulophora]
MATMNMIMIMMIITWRKILSYQLMINHQDSYVLRLKDVVSGHQTLAFQLKPKTVVLRVSMHCNGCARQVEKHVAKLDGVSSYEVDLESKRVVVIGDILPFQVLESVSRVKYAQLLNSTAQ